MLLVKLLKNKASMKEHPTFCKDLSQLYMGTIMSNDGGLAQTFEQFYQCSKVYPGKFDVNGNLYL